MHDGASFCFQKEENPTSRDNPGGRVMLREMSRSREEPWQDRAHVRRLRTVRGIEGDRGTLATGRGRGAGAAAPPGTKSQLRKAGSGARELYTRNFVTQVDLTVSVLTTQIPKKKKKNPKKTKGCKDIFGDDGCVYHLVYVQMHPTYTLTTCSFCLFVLFFLGEATLG